MLNPGGSIKDRVAAEIMRAALADGRLAPGGTVTEGTMGSTGISLALCARAAGCRAFVAMPDDAALEKSELLRTLGAEVSRVRPVSITHPGHFVNVAQRRATAGSAVFADQFENPANFDAHLRTGREILEQTAGDLDAFVCGAGTGGTIAGISAALKRADAAIRVFLVDPPGSSLFNKVQWIGGREREVEKRGLYFWCLCQCIFFLRSLIWNSVCFNFTRVAIKREHHQRLQPSTQYLPLPVCQVARGVLFTKHEAEGKRLRNPFDTIMEGIGLNRLTANFARARVDGAFQGSDREAVEMAAYLLRNDGLFVGSSSAMNCVGAVKAARLLGPGHTVVTVLCDGGARHLSRFHSAAYLESQGLTPVSTGDSLDFVEPGPYKPALRPGQRVQAQDRAAG